MSLDGKTTRHDESQSHLWASAEDQHYFQRLKKEHTAIIMGRGTFIAIRDVIQIHPEQERYVLTHHPDAFAEQAIPSQLTFTDRSPQELLEDLEGRGHTKALLVGGALLAESFFATKCVQEIWVTMEPWIFGTGRPLVEYVPMNISLQLLECERWNERGTLFLRYRVNY
jgi:dihydrofolate reductase